MKVQIIRSIFTAIMVTLFLVSHAQKENLAIIKDIPESQVWNIVYQSFKIHNRKLGDFNKQTQTAKSGYYRYTSLVIENRAKYQVTYKNGDIEIKFVEKQYLSKEGWVNNLLPTSKGTKKKYIYPIAATIRELNKKTSANVPPVSVLTDNSSCPGLSVVTYKGQIYNTVLIGQQCWLKENLNAGLMINDSETMKDNSVLEKYCYDNNPANCGVYGGLYTWDELMQYTSKGNTRGICPEGWQIPSKDDFQVLIRSLGGMEVAGAKLKKAKSNSWQQQSHPATNESGFTALPGGVGDDNGLFEDLGALAYFASSNAAWGMILQHDSHQAKWGNLLDNRAVSVRCIKSKKEKDDKSENPIKEPEDDTINDPKTQPDNKPEDEIIIPDPQIEIQDSTEYNPPQTNCPKKEYLLYFPFSDKEYLDSINNIASQGYKLILGNVAVFFFEKEEGRKANYPFKLLESVEQVSIEELNTLAKEKWVVVNSFFMTYLIKDESAPIYEYMRGKELSNTYMRDYKRFLPGGSNIHDLNNLYGDKGWELISIAGNKSLFRRIIGSNIKYKYKRCV